MNETIKALREANNFTQSEIAGYLGISRQMYIKYESGDVEPPVSVVKLLSKKYDVNYDVIIDNKRPNGKVEYMMHNQTSLQVASPDVSYTSNNYSVAYSFAKKLKYDELFKLLSEIVKLMEGQNTKSASKKLSIKESLSLLDKYTGCIDKEKLDYKEEWYSYLDERYDKTS